MFKMYQLYKNYHEWVSTQVIRSAYYDLLLLIKNKLNHDDLPVFEQYINNLLQHKYDYLLKFSENASIIISYYLDIILDDNHNYVINRDTIRIYLVIVLSKILKNISNNDLSLFKDLFYNYGCTYHKYFISDNIHNLPLNICNLPYKGKLELLELYNNITKPQITKKRKLGSYDNSINKLPLRKKSWNYHCGLKNGETICQICNYNKINQRNFYNSYKIDNGDKKPKNMILSCYDCVDQPSKGNDFKTKVWKLCLGGLKIGQTKCFCCGDTDITLISAVDGHILADKYGGKKILENILPICCDCNSSMGEIHMFEFMKESQFSFDRIPKYYHKYFPEYFRNISIIK